MSLLLLVLVLPLIGSALLLFIPNWNYKLIRSVALNTSIITFLTSLLLWIEFDNCTAKFQFLESLNLVKHTTYSFYQ